MRIPGIEVLRNKIPTLKHALGYYLWRAAGARPAGDLSVLYIGEGGDWVIGRIGRRLSELMNSRRVGFQTRESSRFAFGSVLHFGSVHSFARSGMRWIGRGNRVIVTMYHSDRGVSPEMDAGIDAVLGHERDIDAIVVSTSIMEGRLADWGFPRNKIVRIPIVIDVGMFRVVTAEERMRLRAGLGIPEDAACIGSFQKDGEGWGEGVSPKLIKGPDVFIEAVAKLSRTRRIHCLLTGPSRGYVKAGLARAGVPFTHEHVSDYDNIWKCYGCLDGYLVTSREEGGPLALMECMASGVPLVTTRVGMAPDIVVDGENGFLVDIGDADAIAERAGRLLSSAELSARFRANGLKAVKALDYAAVAPEYESLYKRLSGKGS